MKKIILAIVLSLSVFLPSQALVIKNAKTTSYTGAEDGNYRDCQGNHLHEGEVAADLHYYPLGTRIKLDGSVYVVGDCGGAVVGRKHFDVFCSSIKRMNRRGTVYTDVEVLGRDTPVLAVKKPSKPVSVAKNTHSTNFHKSNSHSVVYSSKGHYENSSPMKQEDGIEVCMD